MPAKPTRKPPRNKIILALALFILGGLIYAFLPKATPVDLGRAERGAMRITIDEEARTRVRDAYVVSAPIAGRLLRLDVEPGDSVSGGETVIARMLASPPSAIDMRTREQAEAGVNAAQAALRVSRADLNKALADQELAEAEVGRARQLRASGTVAQATLDQAERSRRSSNASVDTAKAAISMREAELANARARLIGFDEQLAPSKPGVELKGTIPLHAPISGRVLRVMQESEKTVSPGEPILEIGDISNDLEIVAELLSTDAVQVQSGDRVMIDNWGGDQPLQGTVQRVEPWGFTKFSALGVEEQRVNVIIGFSNAEQSRPSLGHGYRVEAQIVVWEKDDVLIVPSSALFRSANGWAVFAVNAGKTVLTDVEVGKNNGIEAELLGGIDEGSELVLYPGPGLAEGVRVTQRKLDG